MDNNTSICNMNKEFIINTIMSRLDGLTLASSASTCSFFRSAASDQYLWKNLCNATWPSIANLSKPMNISAFDKLYADAFPLILPRLEGTINYPIVAQTSPSDLYSFVDIYYKGKCILSKSLDVIPDSTEFNNNKAYKNRDNNTFKLDLLPVYEDSHFSSIEDYEEIDDCITNLDSLSSSTDKEKSLAEDIKLSWIMFDKKSRKAVNISSWKPVFVQKNFSLDGEYVLHFGSVVPLTDSKLKFAEFKIVARCQLINNTSYVKWTEISMRVEYMAGAHLTMTESMEVFSQALYSKRTTKHVKVGNANIEYIICKKEMKKRHDRREYLVDHLYTFGGLTVLIIPLYFYALLVNNFCL